MSSIRTLSSLVAVLALATTAFTGAVSARELGDGRLHGDQISEDEAQELRYGGDDTQDFYDSVSNLTLGPGSRICTPAEYAYSNVDAQGTSTGVAQFTVQWSSNGYNAFNPIYQANATAFHAVFSPYTHPYNFPGVFKLCVKNNGTSSIRVSAGLSGY